ncbi:flavin monoamine oxidase family protein [Kordia sp.]|uniref:flavin monoamine oxidase family protein n=1 Tax=Kordia sp. TaxID=1965332 RepID=UPI003D27780F
MDENEFSSTVTFLRKTDQNGGELEMLTTTPDKKQILKRQSGHKLINDSVGEGKEAVVLGAGVAGLSIACELLKHTKYKVTILEAQNRVGGRSLTVRPGDSFTENPENKPTTSYTQTCNFTVEDMYNVPYLNCGPGRIPSAHRDVLNYCKTLGVKLEVYVMQSRSNVVYDGKKFVDAKGNPEAIVNRRLANDPRGYFSQFLHALPALLKTIEQSGDATKYKEFLRFVQPLIEALDESEDNEVKFKDWVKKFGNLSQSGIFEKTSRSGYTELPGKTMLGEEENIIPKLDFTTMLDSEFWKLSFYQPDDFLWQQTSFQPVGGMDMIVKALAIEVQKLGGTIILNAPVTEISRKGDQYNVRYSNGDTTETKTAHKCFSNMPIPLLQDKITKGLFTNSDFEKALRTVFDHKEFLRPTVKVGWQSKRKYWQDPENKNTVPIFGGISWTKNPMVQMWYPSNDYHQNLGILTGAYNFSGNAEKWGNQEPQWRLDEARKGAEQLHGKAFADQLKHGLTVAWQNIKTQRGGWVDWIKIDDQTKDPNLNYHEILRIRKRKMVNRSANEHPPHESAEWVFNTLQEGDHGFYIIGDQLSSLPGWQEGAIASALIAFGLCTDMEGFEAPKLRQVPYTAQLVEGR